MLLCVGAGSDFAKPVLSCTHGHHNRHTGKVLPSRARHSVTQRYFSRNRSCSRNCTSSADLVTAEEPACAATRGQLEVCNWLGQQINADSTSNEVAHNSLVRCPPGLSYAQLSTGTVVKPDIVEVLTQQLAEQCIPMPLPYVPSIDSADSQQHNLSTAHLPAKADVPKQFLLERYLDSVIHNAQLGPEPAEQPSTQSQHLNIADAASQSDTTLVSTSLRISHLHHFPLASAQSDDRSSESARLTCIRAALHSSNSKCNPTAMHRPHGESCDCHTTQLETLQFTHSKGQTRKGLALQQALLAKFGALSDDVDEASVQNVAVAGGGGLLHGGSEDGGEGRGPSRGWGGAAREEGDAEEDEDEDTDEEDEDQDEDDNDNDDDDGDDDDDASSSTSSTSSINEPLEYLWQNEAAATSSLGKQYIRDTVSLPLTLPWSSCSSAVTRQLTGYSCTDSGAAASTSRAGEGDVKCKNYPPAQAQHQAVVQTSSKTVSRVPFLPRVHKEQHSLCKHKRQKQQNFNETAPALQYVLNFAGRFCINVLSYSI